jgi:hypothetical protein
MIRTALFIAVIAASGAATAQDKRATQPLAATGDTSASFGIGVDYSSGDYGSDVTTEILSVPVTARARSGNWGFRASLPWVRVSGDPNVLPSVGLVDNLNPVGRGRDGIGGAPVQGQTETGTASGIGDLTLGATYSLPTGSALGVDLGVNAKIGTADADKGLGTGANDYGVSVDLYRDFDGTMLFGGAGYTRLGTSPFIDVDSIGSGNVGVSQRVGASRVGGMVEYRGATVSGLDPRVDAVGFLNVPTGGKGTFQVYLSRGLTDSSPTWGVGMALSL